MNYVNMMTLACLLAFSVSADEEWEKNKDKPRQMSPARRYEQYAKTATDKAKTESDPVTKNKLMELAGKYEELAEHKRKASKAQRRGKTYDWKEYHETQSEAKQLKEELVKKKETHEAVKPAKKEKDHHVKPKEKDHHVKPKEKTYETESGFKIRTAL